MGRTLILVLAVLVAGPAAAPDGRALYEQRCGICHLQGGTGQFMLSRRLGPGKSLLADRTDLQGAYVRQVARQGIASMPRFTRAELSDAELKRVVDYLNRPRP